ncbi:MAG: hypothetical protein V3571_01695 [Pseudodesulfovibrio sp.]
MLRRFFPICLLMLCLSPLTAAQAAPTGFRYPVDAGPLGNGYDCAEGVTPETNDIYLYEHPNGSADTSRGGTGSIWHNVSDVGNFLNIDYTFGLHPGEDWNYGSGNQDCGKPVFAVADGTIEALEPTYSTGYVKGGWRVVLRHGLQNGRTVYSVYLHVTSVGKTNGALVSGKSDFLIKDHQRLVVGDIVRKGDMIARVAAGYSVEGLEEGETMTNVPTHLHFELRDGPFSYAHANKWGYYTDEIGMELNDMTADQVKKAFANMRKDHLLDPSDFIDLHQFPLDVERVVGDAGTPVVYGNAGESLAYSVSMARRVQQNFYSIGILAKTLDGQDVSDPDLKWAVRSWGDGESYNAHPGSSDVTVGEGYTLRGSQRYPEGDYQLRTALLDTSGSTLRLRNPVLFTVLPADNSLIIDNDQSPNSESLFEVSKATMEGDTEAADFPTTPGYFRTALHLKGGAAGFARWTPRRAGRFRLYAFIPAAKHVAPASGSSTLPDIPVRYKIVPGSGATPMYSRPVNQSAYSNQWVQLIAEDGAEAFDFDTAGYVGVALGASGSNADIGGLPVAVDAIKFLEAVDAQIDSSGAQFVQDRPTTIYLTSSEDLTTGQVSVYIGGIKINATITAMGNGRYAVTFTVPMPVAAGASTLRVEVGPFQTGTTPITVDPSAKINLAPVLALLLDSPSAKPISYYRHTIAAGTYHSLAIKDDDTLWAWGRNDSQQLGDGTLTQRNSPLQITTAMDAVSGMLVHSLGIRMGYIHWWGHYAHGLNTYWASSPIPLDSGSTATIIAVYDGGETWFALLSDGTVRAWGNNSVGQVGDGTTDYCESPKLIGSDFRDLATSTTHTLALKSNGTLWAWGQNSYGVFGDGTTTGSPVPKQITSGYAAIAAGTYHTLALKENGSLWSWGRNDNGQLGDGTKSDRKTPKCIGYDYTSVAAGPSNSFGIKADGSLWAWGENGESQLGDGGQTDRTTPTRIGEHYVLVAPGPWHTLGLKTDGSLWAWGDNTYGQLGTGNTTPSLVPVLIGTGFHIPGGAYIFSETGSGLVDPPK